jgi:putative transposase
MPEKQYHSSSHSKYLLKVHIIFCCKYRKHLLKGKMNESMKQILNDIGDNSDFNILVMETDADHVHLMLDYPPILSVLQMVNRLKSVFTVRIWKIHEDILCHHFWKARTFWSDGYFACSTGDASAETIKKYIEQQG